MLSTVLVEADEAIALAHLIRDLADEKPLPVVLNRWRSVRPERAKHLGGIDSLPGRSVEPEFVAQDASPGLTAVIAPLQNRIPGRDPFRRQVVVDVLALKALAGLTPPRAAVEIVAAGLHDAEQGDSACRDVGVVPRGLNVDLFHRRVVPVHASLVAVDRRGGNALERLPG